MAYASINSRDVITAISDRSFQASAGYRMVEINGRASPVSLLGRRVARHREVRKLAVVCNWGQACGISTYTGYLVAALRGGMGEVRIFSEEGCPAEEGVVPCWVRGKSMHGAMRAVLEWQPDFVLVQHEFGLFPKAPYLLQMLQMLEGVPYAVVLHSTYEHLDKTVCTSAMKQIIVHTEAARGVLRRLGNGNRIDVVPHGCVVYGEEERKELWNIFQTDHAVVQFGFGFFYKGVDRAVEAIHLLRTRDPAKYRDIFYLYLCSENSHTRNIHVDYMDFIAGRIESLGLQDNVAIIKKYHSDQEINTHLRTAKLAIFPYLINPGNVVYGASGAIRVAMANGIPVLASESHLFDELPVPRPSSAGELATEIDRVFSDRQYRSSLVAAQDRYVGANAWSLAAAGYREVMESIRSSMFVTLD